MAQIKTRQEILEQLGKTVERAVKIRQIVSLEAEKLTPFTESEEAVKGVIDDSS